MTARRSRGEGGLHWDETRQRWIATVTVGFDARGKRITRKASGTSKTDAKAKLKALLSDQDDGMAATPAAYSVADAVRDWLAFGLADRSEQCLKPVDDLEGPYPSGDLEAIKQDRRANAGRKGTTRAHRSSWSCRRR